MYSIFIRATSRLQSINGRDAVDPAKRHAGVVRDIRPQRLALTTSTIHLDTFKDNVWRKFLHDNARKVLKLDP
jgi:hypothetical protein